MKLKELREKRAKLYGQIKTLADRQAEWTAEDQQRWDALNTEFDAATAEIEREERADTVATRARTLSDLMEARRDPHAGVGREDTGRRGDAPRCEYRGIDLCRAGDVRLAERMTRRAEDDYATAFQRYLASGVVDARALSADLDQQGGYLVPTAFIADLLMMKDNLVFLRQLATVYAVPGAESLGRPSLDADPADPTWTAELATGTEDASMAFGRRELTPHPLAKRVKISKKLMRVAVLNPEALVRDRLAYKFGVTEENAFLNGSGAGQPLGVFVASDDGIPTSRDVSTGNSATAIAADNLFEVKYALKAQYWPRATWVFHRLALKQIRLLKDGENQYLWQPGLQAGQPDRLLDFPVRASEYAPSTFTASAYVGILGDFSYYWIADALDLAVQRLVELYAEANQDGFIGRAEVDGMPALAEAFVRVQLAAGGS